MTKLFALLFRSFERSWSGVAIAVVGLLLIIFRDGIGVPKFLSPVITVIGLGIAFFQFMRETRGFYWVWRILRPRYRGLDDFLKRIDSNSSFLGSFITHADGSISLDAPSLVRSMGSIVERIHFCGADEKLLEIASAINAHAFSGSRYQNTVRAKLERNGKICSRNGLAIAVVQSPHDPEQFDGVTGVFPLNAQAAPLYQMGKLSDNDMSAHHVAALGAPASLILTFMIGNAPVKKGTQLEVKRDGDVFEDLLKMCLIQIILLSFTTKQKKDMFVLTVNSQAKMQKLFSALSFHPRDDLKSADHERVFGLYVNVMRAGVAAGMIARRNPGIAEIIAPCRA